MADIKQITVGTTTYGIDAGKLNGYSDYARRGDVTVFTASVRTAGGFFPQTMYGYNDEPIRMYTQGGINGGISLEDHGNASISAIAPFDYIKISPSGNGGIEFFSSEREDGYGAYHEFYLQAYAGTDRVQALSLKYNDGLFLGINPSMHINFAGSSLYDKTLYLTIRSSSGATYGNADLVLKTYYSSLGDPSTGKVSAALSNTTRNNVLSATNLPVFKGTLSTTFGNANAATCMGGSVAYYPATGFMPVSVSGVGQVKQPVVGVVFADSQYGYITNNTKVSVLYMNMQNATHNIEASTQTIGNWSYYGLIKNGLYK